MAASCHCKKKNQQISKIDFKKSTRKMLLFVMDEREKSVGVLCDVTAGLNAEGHFLLFTSG